MKRFIYKITHPLIRLYWKTFRPKTYGSRGIILHENNILLVKNINVQHWSLAGGKIDPGENPEQCLLRELKEELNLSEIRAVAVIKIKRVPQVIIVFEDIRLF